MAGTKGHSGVGQGGAKPGAGRPRTGPLTIAWGQVLAFAKSGAAEKDIISALDIKDRQLGTAEIEKLRATITRGHALARIELLRDIHVRSRRTKGDGTDGSVNSQALRARNLLDWDRQIPTQEVPPDLGTARGRLGDLLLKLARDQSAARGKTVTVAEILDRESKIVTGEK